MELTFDIAERWSGDIPVLTVSGEIDVATAPQLRDHLGTPEIGEATIVVVDLTEVSFLDSTALGVLVGAHRRRSEAGGEIRLVVTEPRILKVFEITDLIRVFRIVGTVDEALQG
jgi:anti-sigma B factor antagonist